MHTKTQLSLATPRVWSTVLVLTCIGIGVNSVAAQDQKPTAAKEAKPVETLRKQDAVPDKPANKPGQSTEKDADKNQPQAAEEKPKPSLTDRFLEELNGKAQEQAGNPLDAIVERMRAAQQRLLKTETDKETRELQTQIVKGLDELIEKLKNQPPPKSNQNQQPPPPMGENDQNMPPPRGLGQPKPQNSEKQGSDGEKQPQGTASNQTQGEKSRQSNNPAAQQRRSAEEEAARQRMAKDVWGHLPPALRQELLNVYSEKFLPKYDELVRKYYEALAEQNRKNP